MDCSGHALAVGLGVFAYSAWECWLGRTDKVKANSTLELIFVSAMVVLLSVWRKYKCQQSDKSPPPSPQ